MYLSCFVFMAWSIYLSCVNVNFVIWMAKLGVGMNGPDCFCVAPCAYIMSGRSLARHVHFVVWHVQCKIHDGMALS